MDAPMSLELLSGLPVLTVCLFLDTHEVKNLVLSCRGLAPDTAWLIADALCRDGDPAVILERAARHGKASAVHHFLRCHSYSPEDLGRAFRAACRHAHADVVTLMIREHGVNPRACCHLLKEEEPVDEESDDDGRDSENSEDMEDRFDDEFFGGKVRNGDNALTAACLNEAGWTVASLLLDDHGMALEEPGTYYGFTALHAAAYEGHVQLVAWLLHRGADVHAKTRCYPQRVGQYPVLLVAVTRGHATVVDVLLVHGADVESRIGDTFYTAMMCAAFYGHVSVVETLLRHGADVESRSEDGLTALMCAVIHGHVSVVKLLLRHGADAGARGNQAHAVLNFAVWSGDVDVVETLLVYGDGRAHSCLETRDYIGDTPLMASSRSGNVNCVELLLRNGACLHSRNSQDGSTPLILASRQGEAGCVKSLLAHGADTEARNFAGHTALYTAVQRRNGEVVRVLQQHLEEKVRERLSGLDRLMCCRSLWLSWRTETPSSS